MPPFRVVWCISSLEVTQLDGHRHSKALGFPRLETTSEKNVDAESNWENLSLRKECDSIQPGQRNLPETRRAILLLSPKGKKLFVSVELRRWVKKQYLCPQYLSKRKDLDTILGVQEIGRNGVALWVQGQPELHGETLSPKDTKKKRKERVN